MEFGQLDNHEVMEGLRNMCVRVLGNYSEEGNWTCNDDAVERAMSQYVEYMTKVGAFSRESIINSARTQPAWRFWMMNCQWAPELRKVAMKVLSQVCNFPSLSFFVLSMCSFALAHTHVHLLRCSAFPPPPLSAATASRTTSRASRRTACSLPLCPTSSSFTTTCAC